jgi:Beta-fructosidases (levanase/invertase)
MNYTKPKYHLMPQRGWMNDLNGGLYHCEKYHMFYLSSPDQGKPYLTKKKWKNKYWGHSTSKDLVTWEEKKTALIPHSDEYRCMSGSIFFLNKYHT